MHNVPMITDVRDFHLAFRHPVVERPSLPIMQRRMLRRHLNYGEWQELESSMDKLESPNELTQLEGLIQVADDIADLIYVLIGMALEYGIPLDAVWRAVQRANMAKLGPNGLSMYDVNGKVCKPLGWSPPDIKQILINHGLEVPK